MTKKIHFLNSASAILVVSALVACSGSESGPAQPQEKQSGEHGEADDGSHIKLNARERASAGFDTLTLNFRILSAAIKAPGEVTVNQYATSQIAPRISAQIVERHVARGEKADKGAALVKLSSVDMADAQGALIVADREWNRVIKLGRDVVSEKRYVEAEVVRQQAKAKLLSFGMAEREIDYLSKTADASLATGEFTLFATRAGTVLNDDFTIGEFVEPGRKLMAISDETIVWVEAQLTTSHAARIKLGASARVKLTDGGWMDGKVIQLHHALDEATRTLSARIEVPNNDDRLHAGDFADVEITTDGGSPVLAAPENALLLIDGAQTAFRIEDDKIYPTKVETGAAGNGWIEITSGLQAGDRIIVNNIYTLKSLLLKSTLGEGHAH